MSVHPRVCGELKLLPKWFAAIYGSSPRVRGTPPLARESAHRRRFIPACAGNSNAPSCATRTRTVHPRVCGELALRLWRFGRGFGSSPRVRGTHFIDVFQKFMRRFIPACAGNSAPATALRAWSTVHPRVCGELLGLPECLLRLTGSSPRVRGTRVSPIHRDHDGRFIPACAGNSARTATLPLPRPVHPRVCGELVNPCRGMGCFGRFIPACAGNSSGEPRQLRSAPVHPRVCGELVSHQRIRRWAVGSSPRVRGTPPRRPSGPSAPRFIPACAGNSLSSGNSNATPPVHPRVCGELDEEGENGWYNDGSSPRVRGTRRG